MAVFIVSIPAGYAGQQAISLQQIAEELAPEKSLTIYPAKTIITLSPKQPVATAVAVQEDKIVGVGTLSQLRELGKKNKVTIDYQFKDKVIIPGLIAQHLHPMLSALTLTSEIIAIEDWELPDKTIKAARSHDEYIKRLQLAEKQNEDPNAILFSWGYLKFFHGQLNRSLLDEKISRARPIIIWHRSAHEFTLNSAALKLLGIDDKYLKAQSKSAQTQANLNDGHFWEQGMFAVLPKILPRIATPARVKRGLLLTRDYLHASGVTVGCEPGGIVSKASQQAQNAVLSPLDSPLRFYYIPDGKTMAQNYIDDDLIAHTESMLNWGQGRTVFLPKQVKLFADGAMFSQLMRMEDGYTDGHHGEWMMNLELFAKAFQQYWDADYQIHIHTNGDEGLKMVLDNLEKNLKRKPRSDHRMTVVHFGFSKPAQVQRIKKLGAIVSANPYYVTALAEPFSRYGIGPQRALQMVRLGDLEKANISFSLHSDMPMAPAKPLFLMHTAVNRLTFSNKVAGKNQRITPLQALKAVTIDAAYSLQLEKQIGSIEVGKLANFTILYQNPLTVKKDAIKSIRIWGTISEGRLLPIK
jgi:hypothetical protein